MNPLKCPTCGEMPDIQLVDRTIGELYRISHCSILVFGDPIKSDDTPDNNMTTLGGAWPRWDQAVKEVKR